MPCPLNSTFPIQLSTNLVQETTDFRVCRVRYFIGACAHDCCFLQAVAEEEFLQTVLKLPKHLIKGLLIKRGICSRRGCFFFHGG